MSGSLQFVEYKKGKTFVAGLFWQTLSSLRDQKSEVKKIASELSFDMSIIRTGMIPQAGFCSSLDGATEGMMSCAAIVAKHYELVDKTGYGGVLCALKMFDDKYLLVAIRDGAILPDGDFIGSEDDVKDRFLQMMSLSSSDWKICVAPAHWGVEDSVEYHFDFYLPKSGSGTVKFYKWWEIYAVTGGKGRKKKIALVVGLISVIALFVTVKKISDYRNLAHLHEQQAEAERINLFTSRKNTRPIEIPRPWINSPSSVAFVDACAANFKQEYWFAGGWKGASYACVNQSSEYTWTRGATSFLALKMRISLARSNDTEDRASASFPMAFASNTEDQLIENSKSLFVDRLYRIGAKFTLKESQVVIPRPVDADPSIKIPEPNYRMYQWVINSSSLVPKNMGYLMDIAGLRIIKMNAMLTESGDLSWTYEGNLYEKI